MDEVGDVVERRSSSHETVSTGRWSTSLKGSEEGVPENLRVPLEGDRYFGELCGSHQGCQVPFRPPVPTVGLLPRRCSGKGLHLSMTGEPRGFSRGVAGFSNYDGEFRMPLVLAQVFTQYAPEVS